MRKILTYICLVIFLLPSCTDDPTKVKVSRRDAIAQEKFVQILADIHLMDAITNNPDYYRKYEALDSIDLYSSIFEKYGVTKAEFDTTVSLYTKKPDLYLEVYDGVIFELNYRLDSLREKKPKFERDEDQQ